MRAISRVIALLVGLSLAVGSALLAVEAVLLYRGTDSLVIPRASWSRSLGTLQWSDADLQVVAVVLIVTGSLLLLLQLAPRRVVRLRIQSSDLRPTWISKRAVRKLLLDTVRRDNDVIDASAKLRRRRAVVAVTTARSIDTTALEERLAVAERDTMADLDLVRSPRVDVRVAVAQDRVR